MKDKNLNKTMVAEFLNITLVCLQINLLEVVAGEWAWSIRFLNNQ
jgi:hypothetical protein